MEGDDEVDGPEYVQDAPLAERYNSAVAYSGPLADRYASSVAKAMVYDEAELDGPFGFGVSDESQAF